MLQELRYQCELDSGQAVSLVLPPKVEQSVIQAAHSYVMPKTLQPATFYVMQRRFHSTWGSPSQSVYSKTWLYYSPLQGPGKCCRHPCKWLKPMRDQNVHISLCIYTYIYIYISVCVYACMYACMHVCMYLCMYACMHACMHAMHIYGVNIYTIYIYI